LGGLGSNNQINKVVEQWRNIARARAGFRVTLEAESRLIGAGREASI